MTKTIEQLESEMLDLGLEYYGSHKFQDISVTVNVYHDSFKDHNGAHHVDGTYIAREGNIGDYEAIIKRLKGNDK